MKTKCILCGNTATNDGALCDECKKVEEYFDNANRDQVHYFYMQLEQKELGYRFDIDQLNEDEIFNKIKSKPDGVSDADVVKQHILEFSQMDKQYVGSTAQKYLNVLVDKYLIAYFKHINKL